MNDLLSTNCITGQVKKIRSSLQLSNVVSIKRSLAVDVDLELVEIVSRRSISPSCPCSHAVSHLCHASFGSVLPDVGREVAAVLEQTRIGAELASGALGLATFGVAVRVIREVPVDVFACFGLTQMLSSLISKI